MDETELRHRFDYHPPRSRRRVAEHEHVRDVLRDTALTINDLVPDGREKSLAVTKLEESMYWANAALARADDPHAEATAEQAAAGPGHVVQGITEGNVGRRRY